MSFHVYEDLGHGITRIDTAMVREELAACYLMRGGEDYAIIETGTHHTVPIILDLLERRGIDRGRVRYVIPTHVHLDHAGGVGGLMEALPDATLLVHPRGARHMIDPRNWWPGPPPFMAKPLSGRCTARSCRCRRRGCAP